ncbi:hypothetical protein DAETH_38600 (plasmid) [Deinococcus aetherius]|uniref:Uncharacterized protein n=1 Tax=Deinococcus aetherius TaxID=200252 RepID=A0ABN6RKS1_9DEIO|nr:hypothetical protein DAETH_38600 [Deinococcus aetherius]
MVLLIGEAGQVQEQRFGPFVGPHLRVLLRLLLEGVPQNSEEGADRGAVVTELGRLQPLPQGV